MSKKIISVFMTLFFIASIFANASMTTFAKETLKITKSPKSVTVANGKKAKVTVKASGDGVKYTWYYKNNGAKKYKKTSVKSKTYTVKMSNKISGRKVYCLIKDKYGNKLKTKVVTLTSSSALRIIKQPSAVSAGHNVKAKVTVKVKGKGVKYTWYYKDNGTKKYKKASTKSKTYSVKMTEKIDGRTVYCLVKDKYGKKMKTVSVKLSLKHSYNSGKITTVATCQKTGVKVYTCNVCKVTKNEIIPKTLHTLDNGTVVKDSTCAEEGIKFFGCKNCFQVVKFEKLSKKPHTSDEGTITKPATVFEEGEKTFKCIYCPAVIKVEKISKVEIGGGSSNLPEENIVGGKSWLQVLESMPKNLQGTNLVMYNWYPASEYTGAPAVIENFSKQTGIKVEWRTITYSNYFTKLPALIASGENIPDIARLRGPQPAFLQNFQPLNKIGYDFSDGAWDQDIMKMYTYGSNTYATTLKNTHLGSPNLMLYNKALIDKYEFEDPYTLWKTGKWNWDKYIEMCRDFKGLTGNNGSCGEGHFRFYTAMHGIQGAISHNGKQFYNAMKEKLFLEVHQKLGDLYNNEKLFAFGSGERFDDGKVLFSTGDGVTLRRKNSYFGALKNANTLYAVPCPEINGQSKYYQGFNQIEAYGIALGAPNAEAAPYFLRYFLDGSNYELSDFFVNEQNLEVYNWCMQQTNKIYAYGYPVGMGGTYNTNSIEVQTGAQMKSFIDANYGITDKSVCEYNEIASRLKNK